MLIQVLRTIRTITTNRMRGQTSLSEHLVHSIHNDSDDQLITAKLTVESNNNPNSNFPSELSFLSSSTTTTNISTINTKCTYQLSNQSTCNIESNIETSNVNIENVTNNESASVHKCIDKWLATISAMRLSTSSSSLSSSELDELEQHIRHGISLPLTTEPSPIHFANTTTVSDHHELVAERIAEYISIGAIQALPSDSPPPLLVQPLHVIIKEGKKPRLVIDLSRNLNQLLPQTSFHYASVQDAVHLSTPHCFYSKLDISNCFLSFPLHPSTYKYFVFQFDHKYYQFVRLPFGLSTAPRVCTLLLSVIQFTLEQLQLRWFVIWMISYSFLILASASAQHLATAIDVCQQFGLVVNAKKTEGPSQQMQFLGIQLDSVACTLSISSQRTQEMMVLLLHHFNIPSSTPVRVKQIMSFVGKLNFVSQVLPSSRPFMRRLLDVIQGKRKQQRCRLPTEFKLDCAIWLQRIQQWNGLISWSIYTQQPFVIVSDASTTGFGFYLQSFPSNIPFEHIPTALLPRSGVSGTWHSSMSHLLTNRSIAYLELFSVVYALTMLASVLHHQSVLILTDNASNVPIINKLRTGSPGIIGLLRSLAELSATHVFACTARHISGESNVLADFLSRPTLHLHQHLSTWTSFELSHSLPLSDVTTVCSSSLHLPNPLPTLHPSMQLNPNVQLNYLPSLISSNPCHYV